MPSTPEEIESLIEEPLADNDIEMSVKTFNNEYRKNRLCSYFLIIVSILCGILGFMIGLLSGSPARESDTLTSARAQFVPAMPIVTVRFEHIEELAQPPSVESNKYWNSLMPYGKGFVTIKNYEDYDLQPGITTSTGNDSFLLSMYHQLHCVAVLRKFYFELIDAINNDMPRLEAKTLITAQLENSHPHHCISYLAQGVLCSADMTLEWASVAEDGSRMVVGGEGVPHRECKDPDAVWNWVMDHFSPPAPGRTGDITE